MTAFWVAEWSRLQKIVGKYVSKQKKGLYQWVLLSWAEVKGRLVEHLHKVLQAGHIHFILHRLPKTHKHKHISPHAELHPPGAQQHTNHSELFILSMQNEIHFNCVSVATHSTGSTSNHLTRHVPSWTLQNSLWASVKLTGSRFQRDNVFESVCDRFKTKGSLKTRCRFFEIHNSCSHQTHKQHNFRV